MNKATWSEDLQESANRAGTSTGLDAVREEGVFQIQYPDRHSFPDSGIKSPLEPTSNSTSVATDRKRVWCPNEHCLELDGLRGIAILSVTLYRFCKELDPAASPVLAVIKTASAVGGRGVDLFFVLSGFLITGILLRTKSSQGYFRNFMARRVLRIFPLYYGALALCLWVLPAVLGTTAFNVPRSEQVYLWTYVSNIRMSWVNEWCFGPLDHFWSLAVEEHFYLVWPLIVFCLSAKALLRLSLALVVGVGMVRAAASLRPEWSVAVEVLTTFRCDALAFGAIAAILMLTLRENEQVARVRRAATLALPVTLLGAVGLLLFGKGFLAIPQTVIPLACAVALLVLVTGPRRGLLSRVMQYPLLRWFGRYSFGMYVVQLPLMTLLPLTLSASTAFAGISPVLTGITYVFGMLSLTSAIAWLSYHTMEKHFLGLKKYF
jgi:peptidoglycan/LPS O-acetylase OafA/YrhL